MSSVLVEGHLPCPSCPSSDAFSLWSDGHGYCFSCLYFKPPKEISFLTEDFTYEFIERRGITAETHQFYGVKAKINSEGKPIAVGYKYPSGWYKIRSLETKRFHTEGDVVPGLFGRDLFTAGGKFVTITEGEDDALSLRQVLGSPVVSVQSSSSALRDCTADFDWLNSFERVYLAFDADQPGRKATGEVAKLFDYNKVYHVRFGNGRKDANDYLQAGEGGGLRDLWWNSRKYLPDTVVSSFADFEKILQEEPITGVPYPFPTLNSMLGGIRPYESILITAQEGVGKTELLHAIEYQLLTRTKDNVGAIFLEEPKGRHLQSLAGIHLKCPVHLPDSNCTPDQIFTAVRETVEMDDRLHVYNHFGSDDPDVLLDTIRFLVVARKCAYVFLDHIGMVVSGLAGEDERKALDYLSTRLEMMVKELGFSLILVSHVNDDGRTRGSRLISKNCDIRIDCTRDVLHPDPLVRSVMHLVVSKNRPIGQTGPAGDLIFDPLTRTYREELSYAQASNDNSRDTKLGHQSAA